MQKNSLQPEGKLTVPTWKETVLALTVEGFLKAVLLERPLRFHIAKD